LILQVSIAQNRAKNFKGLKSHERCCIETIYSEAVRMLNVKRLIKTYKRYKNWLDASSFVSLTTLNALKGMKLQERLKFLRASGKSGETL